MNLHETRFDLPMNCYHVRATKEVESLRERSYRRFLYPWGYFPAKTFRAKGSVSVAQNANRYDDA